MASSQLTKEYRLVSPPWTDFLFNKTTSAWLWLIVRLYLGYSWFEHGLEKLSNPAWVQTGEALKGFWQRAVAIPEPPARPPDCL